MAKNKHIIRIGDKVKIINPHIFERVGYNNTKNSIIRAFDQNQNEIIEELVNSFGINDKNHEISLRIADALAYGILKRDGFGGTERKIFTEYDPCLLDVTATVIDRKVVNTGTYHASHGHYTWEGDYDYDPAYLSKQKSHVIFTISPNRVLYTYEDVKIEKINLEKI